MSGKIMDFIAPILGAAAGSLIAPGIGTAIGAGIGSGVNTGVETGNPLAGLTSGVASGAGSYLGSNLLGGIGGEAAGGAGGSAGSAAPVANAASSILATPGQSATDAFMGPSSTGIGGDLFGGSTQPSLAGGGFGDSIAAPSAGAGTNAASSGSFLQRPMSSVISQGLGGGNLGTAIGSLGGTANVGNALGGTLGSSVASNILGPSVGGLVGGPSTGNPPPGVMPNMALPGDMSSFAGMPENQLLSNMATQGVYGNGLGPQDQQYFLNQLNNTLTTGPNQYSPMSNISPIENSMLAQMGLGGMSNTQSLLTALQGWQPPQT